MPVEAYTNINVGLKILYFSISNMDGAGYNKPLASLTYQGSIKSFSLISNLLWQPVLEYLALTWSPDQKAHQEWLQIPSLAGD